MSGLSYDDPFWSTVRGLLGKVYDQVRKAKRQNLSYKDQGSPAVGDSHGAEWYCQLPLFPMSLHTPTALPALHLARSCGTIVLVHETP